MLNEDIENETGEEMRERIKIRDGKAKMIEDLRENFSGRTWFKVDVLGDDAE